MINNFDKFTVREIFGTFIPGLYFTTILGKIITPLFNVQKNDINSFDYFILFIISTLVGLVIYSLDFPKKIYFFKNNTPTYLLNKKIKSDNLSINEIELKNAFFNFYDVKVSSNQRGLTEKITTLFHFSSNIFLCSIIVLIIELIKYFNNYIIDCNLFLFNSVVVILALISVLGLFYGENKINSLFQRQFKAFICSEEYKDLVK